LTSATYAAEVADESLDRLTSGAGLLGYVLVGLVALLSGLAATVSPWWWVAYAAGLGTFGLLCADRVGVRAARGLLAPLFVAVLLTYLLAPDYGISAVPMVIFVATAAFLLQVWATLSLIGIQTAVLVVASVLQDGDRGFGAAVAVMYAVFQLFALVMVETSLREHRMREELGVANAELAAAQGRLAETSKVEERLRISRDLHDLVGHQLSALAVNLEVASHLAEGPATEPVARSRVIAKDLLSDVRQVVGRLREPRARLGRALADLAVAVPTPRVVLDVHGDLEELGQDEAEVVLRCVQELITNAMRHAEAEHLWITLTCNGGELVLSARDDGRGATEVAVGHGLTGMRERVGRLGGELSWDGADGFRVEARLRTAA
jgi:signal transduction histidine kinase